MLRQLLRVWKWSPFVVVRESIFVRRLNGYRFNILFFQAVIIILLAFTFYAAFFYGFQPRYYWSCPITAHAPCLNPFIDESGGCRVSDRNVCWAMVLAPGESFGDKPPWFIEDFENIALLLILSAFFCNHWFMNVRWSFWNGSK
jgi:hypothetical protein